MLQPFARLDTLHSNPVYFERQGPFLPVIPYPCATYLYLFTYKRVYLQPP